MTDQFELEEIFNLSILAPLGFESQADFDFPLTAAEREGGWDLANRCGQRAKSGSDKDQRNDIRYHIIISKKI